MPELAVSKTKVLLGVSEECLDAPSHRVQLDEMARECVDLVRHDVLHTRFVILVIATRFFCRNQQLDLTETTDFTLLRPDLVGVAVNRPRNRVDALAERVDTSPFTTVRDAHVTLDGGNPLFTVAFEVSHELLGTVAYVEEIGVRRDTYLDDFVNEIDNEFNATFRVLFVEAEAERICGFLIGVECVNEVLSPDVAWDGVVVEFSRVGDFLACFVCEGVVDDDDTFTGPAGIVGLLEKLQALFVQLVFVPVVLGEELVESAFALGWKHVRGDTVHGLVAGRNKTGDVGLGVVLLPGRKAL